MLLLRILIFKGNVTNKMTLDISFIIPIHNNPVKELIRCIDTIKKIENKTFEVLIIDNASDLNKSIQYKKVALQNNCNYIFTKKIGVSNARNIGLNNAKGSFVPFVDADDKIKPKIFNEINLSKKIDLYIFDILVKQKRKTSILGLDKDLENSFLNINVLIKYFVTSFKLNNSSGKLFSLSFLKKNGIQFNPELINGEDATFVSDVIIKNPTTYFVNKVSYVYYQGVVNANHRIVNNPKLAYKSLDYIFKLKYNLISHIEKSYSSKSMKNIVKSEYIKDLSNIFLDLWSTDMIEAKEVKRIILNKFKYLKVQKEYPNSVNIRILILQSNNNWLIHILQNVRLKYLKYKYGKSLK